MVSQDTSCDWCGRPGTLRRYSCGGDPETEFENPYLCDVCSFFILNTPSGAVDYFMESMDYESAMQSFEVALHERYLARLKP